MIPSQAPYVGHHYALTATDVDRMHADGRTFYAVSGEQLQTPLEIRTAFRRDHEVISR